MSEFKLRPRFKFEVDLAEIDVGLSQWTLKRDMWGFYCIPNP